MKTVLRFICIALLPVFLFSCGRSDTDDGNDIIDPEKLLLSEEIANHDCDRHGHVFSKATCLQVSTCFYCGETVGEKGNHDRTKPTCLKKSFCTVCDAEFGELGNHIFTEASCAGKVSCAVCGVSSGTMPPHKWKAATCVTPSMCTVCMEKSGSALGHNWTGGSCTEGKTCTRCSRTDKPAGHKMSDGSCTKDSVCSVCGYTVKALGHTFESGKCSVCGKTQQQAVEESRIDEQNKTTEAPDPTTQSADVEPLKENARKVLTLCNEAHALCQTAIDDIYGIGNETALSAVEKLSSAILLIDSMSTHCNTDIRLNGAKAYLTAVKKPIEKYSQIKSFNQSSILKNVVDMRAACTEAKNACDKLIKYVDTLS